MIRIYAHRDPKTAAWLSPDEHAGLWACRKHVGWQTNQFVPQLQALRDSDRWFEVREYDETAKGRGMYLMFCGNKDDLQECVGLAALKPEVRDRINAGELDLLVVFTHEGFDDWTLKEWQNYFCTHLGQIGLTRANSVKVLLGVNSLEMSNHRDWRVQWIYYPFIEAMTQTQALKVFRDQPWPTTDFTGRQHRFLSLGGVMRVHRLIMTMYLEYLGITEHAYVSMQPTHLPWDHYVEKNNNMHYGISCNAEFKKFLDQNKIPSGSYANSNDRHRDSHVTGWFNTGDYYRESCVDLVQETHYAMWNCTFLTEKTYRPMVYGLPFMINGCRNSLDTLRREGYQTFPELWDEGYQDLMAGINPIMHIGDELKKFVLRNDFYTVLNSAPIQEKLRHNQRLFFERNHAQLLHDALCK